MATNTQSAGKEIDAGIYIRAKRHIRFWRMGRNKKELANLSGTETERPWAGLAEWLRVAHSLLDEKNSPLTRSVDRPNQLRAIE
jgi:hypothetical protein